nr:MAG TPA: hypothetical protein [Caudoviricetes sp.]
MRITMPRMRMRMSARAWKSNKSAYNDGDVSLMWSRGKRATAKAPIFKVES